MQVLPINNSYHNVAFKGLWGQEVYEVSSTTDGGASVFRTKNYFPFLDETKSKIDSIIKECQRGDYTISGLENGVSNSVTTVVNCHQLPFTEKDYNYYKYSEQLVPEKRSLVVKTLKKLGLTKYLNKCDSEFSKGGILSRIFHK